DVAEPFFREMFKLASLFVGKQTEDPNLRADPRDPNSPQKPIVLVNHNKCWDPFLEMVENMRQMGTITQKEEKIFNHIRNEDEAGKSPTHRLLNIAHDTETAVAFLKRVSKQKDGYFSHRKSVPQNGDAAHHPDIPEGDDPKEERKPKFNVC